MASQRWSESAGGEDGGVDAARQFANTHVRGMGSDKKFGTHSGRRQSDGQSL